MQVTFTVFGQFPKTHEERVCFVLMWKSSISTLIFLKTTYKSEISRNAQYQPSFPLTEKDDSFAIDFEENRTIMSALKSYCSEDSILLSLLF